MAAFSIISSAIADRCGSSQELMHCRVGQLVRSPRVYESVVDQSGETVDRGIEDDSDLLVRAFLNDALVLAFVDQIDEKFEGSLCRVRDVGLLRLVHRRRHGGASS
ncbi:hypothetical protein [Brevibacterium sp. UCMA 11754]|uniref:hypothetical protein n=1 Tax=Brevibacterium sp. UCMA 11754 TaxID=2749198 RepID=UPI001F3F62DB|nr:hypothetical protein [Brevibacterium sp. UCMA 11754]MCF2573328.1 hypothetical protein [Brevibacterium sp. UCMA 11754]